jgi:hypothetical protein
VGVGSVRVVRVPRGRERSADQLGHRPRGAALKSALLLDEREKRTFESKARGNLVIVRRNRTAVAVLTAAGAVLLVVCIAGHLSSPWPLALIAGAWLAVNMDPQTPVVFVAAGIGVKRTVVTTWSEIEGVDHTADVLVVRYKTRTLRIKAGADLIDDARRYVLCRVIAARGLAGDVEIVIAYLRSPTGDYRHAPPIASLRAVAGADIIPQAIRDEAAQALGEEDAPESSDPSRTPNMR